MSRAVLALLLLALVAPLAVRAEPEVSPEGMPVHTRGLKVAFSGIQTPNGQFFRSVFRGPVRNIVRSIPYEQAAPLVLNAATGVLLGGSSGIGGIGGIGGIYTVPIGTQTLSP